MAVPRHVGLALLTLLLAAGCGTATEVLVVTDSDLVVPGELDSLEVVVQSPAGVMQSSSADLTGQPLPRTLSLVHETGPLGPFDVSVSGRQGGRVVVTRQASFSFVSNQTRVLEMHLVAACRTASCPGQTCTERGCRDVAVPESELGEWSGSPPRLSGSGDGGAPDGCTPGAEACNGADDDCDGTVDEDFDLMTDPDNCGACGNGCNGRNGMCCGGMCMRRCP